MHFGIRRFKGVQIVKDIQTADANKLWLCCRKRFTIQITLPPKKGFGVSAEALR